MLLTISHAPEMSGMCTLPRAHGGRAGPCGGGGGSQAHSEPRLQLVVRAKAAEEFGRNPSERQLRLCQVRHADARRGFLQASLYCSNERMY